MSRSYRLCGEGNSEVKRLDSRNRFVESDLNVRVVSRKNHRFLCKVIMYDYTRIFVSFVFTTIWQIRVYVYVFFISSLLRFNVRWSDVELVSQINIKLQYSQYCFLIINFSIETRNNTLISCDPVWPWRVVILIYLLYIILYDMVVCSLLKLR